MMAESPFQPRSVSFHFTTLLWLNLMEFKWWEIIWNSTHCVGGNIIIHFPLFCKLKLWYRHRQLVNCVHCATVNLLPICSTRFHFICTWQTGGGSFNKRKNNLALGSCRNRIFYILHLTTVIFASFYTVRRISDLACSKLLEMKSDNDPVGSPVSPLKLCYKI